MKRRLVLVWCLSAAVSGVAQEDPRLESSRQLAARLQQALGAELMTAMSAGGPVEAIDACHVSAPIMAAELSEESGVRIGRTALRTRNPGNAPDADAREVLLTFERDLAAGASLPEHFEARPDGSGRYMSAIVTQPLCLACHGSALAPGVAAAITERYPADQATGFEVGDLRGAFLIEWPVPGGD